MRRINPFSRKNNTVPVAADTATNRDDAVAVLGEVVVGKLSDVVDATPGLLDATVSAVTPDEVDDPAVTLVGIIIDTSWSADRYMPIQGQAHDELIDALLPALGEGVAILATCSTLDGTVVYPLTRIQDIKRFGRTPAGLTREVPGRNGQTIRVDETGQPVAENNLTYGHMPHMFRMIDNTPLRDRVREQVTALLAEMVKWGNPRIARTVKVISAVLTDGLDNRSKTKPSELSDLVGELEGGGYFTALATFIGDVNDPEFRSLLKSNITGRRNGYTLPDDHKEKSNEELLRWWLYEQGLAAEEDRLWLPGTDPKAIRRAAGQMSQTAFQESTSAFREEDNTAEIPTAQ